MIWRRPPAVPRSRAAAALTLALVGDLAAELPAGTSGLEQFGRTIKVGANEDVELNHNYGISWELENQTLDRVPLTPVNLRPTTNGNVGGYGLKAVQLESRASKVFALVDTDFDFYVPIDRFGPEEEPLLGNRLAWRHPGESANWLYADRHVDREGEPGQRVVTIRSRRGSPAAGT